MSESENMVGYFGTVARVVDEFGLVINKGSDDGVSKGDRFLIYGVGDVIRDPESGESLGQLESVRGTGTVSHVQDRISTVKSDAFEKPVKTVRRIKRTDAYSMVMGRGSETIEEEDGNLARIPFADPQEGDRVRPV